MALHTELPIYRTGVRLLDLAVRAQVQMPRTVKRALGAEVQPWAGAYLMAEHRVKTPALVWANQWMWRTAALISYVETSAAAKAMP